MRDAKLRYRDPIPSHRSNSLPKAAYPRPYPGPPPFTEEAGGAQRGLVYVVIFVVVAAFGGVVWNIYGGRAQPPRIEAPVGAYKTAPSPDGVIAADPDPQNSMYDALDGHEASSAAIPRPAPEAPIETLSAPGGAQRVSVAPTFAADGPYVAQVAALQSEAAVEASWTRLSTRAPQLFQAARMDVERADLGQRGIYFRVRAGYFADRANATRFCDRVRQMGQDCIVVSR